MLYKCVRTLDNSPQPVEIIDCAATPSHKVSEEHLLWAEAFVIVFSVCDKESFHWATTVLDVSIYQICFILFITKF